MENLTTYVSNSPGEKGSTKETPDEPVVRFSPASRSLRRRVLQGAPSPGTWVPPLVLAVVLFAVLELLVRSDVLPQDRVPRPTDVAEAFANQILDGPFWSAVWATVQSWGIGLAIAVLLAIPIGTVAGLSTFTFRSLQFVVDFLRPIPPVALLPLLVLLFGISPGLKWSLAAIGAFFPLFFATLYGVQDLDPVMRDTSEVYRLNRRYRFLFVILPGATPYIATGLRVSATIALLLVVGAEMVVGVPGIGHNIVQAQYANNLAGMYALIAAAGLLGVAITAACQHAERRVLHWHPSQRGTTR